MASSTTPPTIRSEPVEPAQDQPIARGDGERSRQTDDRAGRPIRQVQCVTAGAAQGAVDGGRPEMDAGSRPVGPGRSELDQPAIAGRHGGVIGEDDTSVQAGA